MNADNSRRKDKPGGGKVVVIGGGIFGLWQALGFADAGYDVALYERQSERVALSASWLAGAMLAPWCEFEAAEALIRELGLEALEIWKRYFPGLTQNGTLVLAHARDLPELDRFKRAAPGYDELDAAGVSDLEPDLGDRFSRALYYSREAHVEPRAVMAALANMLEERGVNIWFTSDGLKIRGNIDWIIDTRGLAARDVLTDLRGVKGEMAVLRTSEVSLSRPVRFLHPRHPLYIVPWSEGHYMVGATMIEADGDTSVTAQSLLELLSAAYTLHPAFGEAEVVETNAGLRPAFPDNLPRIVRRGKRVFVNGAYRHGFLLAPVLARMTVDLVAHNRSVSEIVYED